MVLHFKYVDVANACQQTPFHHLSNHYFQSVQLPVKLNTPFSSPFYLHLWPIVRSGLWVGVKNLFCYFFFFLVMYGLFFRRSATLPCLVQFLKPTTRGRTNFIVTGLRWLPFTFSLLYCLFLGWRWSVKRQDDLLKIKLSRWENIHFFFTFCVLHSPPPLMLIRPFWFLSLACSFPLCHYSAVNFSSSGWNTRLTPTFWLQLLCS